MADKKRIPKSYKITEAAYSKALKRGAKKGNMKLSNLLEKVATAYGHGFDIIISDKFGKQESLTK